MTYLLDTNTCIQYLNGRSENIRQHLESKQPQDIGLCSVVKAELFYGVMKSKKPEENLMKLRRFVSHFVSLPFDDNAAEIYGRIRTQLEKSGTPIGPNDLLIRIPNQCRSPISNFRIRYRNNSCTQLNRNTLNVWTSLS